MTAPRHGPALEADVAARNHDYDDATSAVWRLAVYEAVHAGREFTNIGGREVLDDLARRAGLGPASEVVELGAGLGTGCRYLAATYGCTVTGLDLNVHQVERARERLAADPAARGRVRFLHGDARRWRSERAVDLVYSMDTLMLVPDAGQVLAELVHAVRPGGMVALAEVTAGPAIDDDVRQTAWTVDGIRTLLSPQEYVALLERLGFRAAEAVDLTAMAEWRFAGIARALVERRAAIVAGVGLASQQSWLWCTQLYHDWFRDRRLGYARISAVR